MKHVLILLLALRLSIALQIQDEANRSVELAHPAQRVVAIPIPLASLSIAIDKNTSRLVAIHPSAKKAMTGKVLEQIFPSVRDLSTKAIGNDFFPNVEEILKLGADLTIQWGHLGEKFVKPLEAARIKTLLIKYGDEKNVLNWLRIIGKAYGKERRTAEFVAWRERVKAQLAKARGEFKKPPRVLYFLRYRSLTAAGEGTFNQYSIALAGGKNISGFSGFKQLSAEEILLFDPEIILLNNFEEDLTPQEVYKARAFAGVAAVKTRAVYKMPLGAVRWDPPSQEAPLAWLWLFEKFSGRGGPLQAKPLREQLKTAYEFLYGYTLSPAQIDGILGRE